MRKYRVLEHTADIGLVAYGKTLAEAYANAGYGLFSIIADLSRVRESESCPVEVAETDAENLLFEWLNYLIYLFDINNILFKRFDVEYFDGKDMKVVCYGERYDPSRHIIKRGIKSATYHMMKVDSEKNRVQVIFDI
ncbi:archease [Chloroflexota bacterium]